MPFFDNVSHSRNLKTSKLSLNSSEAGLSESHTSLTFLTSLRILSLYNNSLSGSLPQQGGLCNLKNLKMLSLGRNKFKGLLPSCLSNLTSLRTIDLQYNGFEGSFPSSLFHSLKSLRFISLEETLSLAQHRFLCLPTTQTFNSSRSHVLITPISSLKLKIPNFSHLSN
ncbi:probable leucine-rich repeat receptor-like protein kinase At1g68400 isoform X2 [Prosopis cineraria]|uniref:probable leucine-rich repeat receptor-like protein kinase At1g68400 isoform X2 n=1 Tax=Prosopis cineraria TaxID=364024 RepID=UPI00240F318C|nr:probable leucine-rich repeat receptor-like protein kinase At1g68400 isoform X2 [Prosopis cineraria]